MHQRQRQIKIADSRIIRVAHLSSAHPRSSSRILVRECQSLYKAGYDVYFVVADGKGDDTQYGVKIIDVGDYRNGRIKRMLGGVKAVYQSAIKLNADVYHFHDPELIVVGLLLRLRKKKVIFDIHENIREQIRTKYWLPCRNLIAKLYPIVDMICSHFFYLVLAESSYEGIYKELTNKYEVIQNMPDIDGFNPFYRSNRTNRGIFYIGRISENRGIFIVLESLQLLRQRGISFHFHCTGEIDPPIRKRLDIEMIRSRLESYVTFYGRQGLNEGYKHSIECKVGISILMPIKNFIESYSTKIFEYMAVGLPVITSDFRLYKDVVEKEGCGICVNPLRPKQVAEAIEKILLDQSLANIMGKAGRKCSEQFYNWQMEERKLVNLYKRIINENIY